MIKLENTIMPSADQWNTILLSMRNPMNSWEKSDSNYRSILASRCDTCTSYLLDNWDDCENCEVHKLCNSPNYFLVGPNDLDLMTRLSKAGTDHRKFMRMITVYIDITAPLYWWKEFDTYKIGTVANSCSTMHKIADKEFTLEDFSCEHLGVIVPAELNDGIEVFQNLWIESLKRIIEDLNIARRYYIREQDVDLKKKYWWQMIQLLPSSYNQKRTVMLNYEVLANIYKSRKGHKLDEWNSFCDWIESLPYSELITGKKKNNDALM